MNSTPKVFISATSADLRLTREIIKQGLLTLGYFPVEQRNFPPDHRSLKELLREKVNGCEALIHVVGRRYGFEPAPDQLPPGTPRRSYTQLEYDTACELGIKVYAFICGDEFPYADEQVPPESPEKVALQQGHRQRLLADHGRFHQPVANETDIEIKVRELQVSLQEISQRHERQRRRMLMGILAAIVVGTAVLGATARTIIIAQAETAEKISNISPNRPKFKDLETAWSLAKTDIDHFTVQYSEAAGMVSLNHASELLRRTTPVAMRARKHLDDLKTMSGAIADEAARGQLVAALAETGDRINELEATTARAEQLGMEWDEFRSDTRELQDLATEASRPSRLPGVDDLLAEGGGSGFDSPLDAAGRGIDQVVNDYLELGKYEKRMDALTGQIEAQLSSYNDTVLNTLLPTIDQALEAGRKQ